MRTSTSEAGLVERLRRNESENKETFRMAGIAGSEIPHVRCQGCSNVDSALFWTPVRVKKAKLHLSCPACGEKQVRYDLRARALDSGGHRLRMGGRSFAAIQLVAWVGIVAWLTTTSGQDAVERVRRSLVQSMRPETRSATPSTSPSVEPSSRPVRRDSAPTSVASSRQILLGEGDRRPMLEEALAEALASGAVDPRLVVSLDYLPELNATRLVADTSAAGWSPWLSERIRAALENQREGTAED